MSLRPDEIESIRAQLFLLDTAKVSVPILQGIVKMMLARELRAAADITQEEKANG